MIVVDVQDMGGKWFVFVEGGPSAGRRHLQFADYSWNKDGYGGMVDFSGRQVPPGLAADIRSQAAAFVYARPGKEFRERYATA